MVTFVVRRVAYSIPVLLIASVLVFGFVRAHFDPVPAVRAAPDLSSRSTDPLLGGSSQRHTSAVRLRAAPGATRSDALGTARRRVESLSTVVDARRDVVGLHQDGSRQR